MRKQIAVFFETMEKNRTLLVVSSHGEVAFLSVFPQTLRQPFRSDWEPVPSASEGHQKWTSSIATSKVVNETERKFGLA